ncbi:uncharacterized protein C2845_PM05G35010 [Panicum miliaceum]|uniref:KIB1-4 beta-propeller domain-containing protein n=1 Tax=Panicum miliaceum TaxID=4540 RepID=A0A3L6SYD8_PANMI|nr:uncharacterized protein C2845_PM05G35010 [Panicum miliaceum]
MAAPRPWANLHADMLREIFLRVPCAIDRVHMAAACNSWLAVLAAEAMEAPPRIPSLFLPPADVTGVYCYLSGCRDHRKFPGPRHFGSYDGAWFFLAYGQTRGHRLLNIRTGESHAVPNVLGDGFADQFHNMVILAATLSLPPDDLECVAAGIVAYQPNTDALRRRHFAFWQLGNEAALCYVEPHPNAPIGPGLEPEDVVYHRGSFHFLTQGEHILECAPVLDDDGTILEVVVEAIRFQNGGRCYAEFVRARYLVASREELLMVVRFAPNPHAPTSSFKVFRMLQQPMPDHGMEEADGHHWYWSELDTLGGRMLFVGRGCSRSYEVGQYLGFKDGVYFLDDGCFYDDEMMFRGVNERRYPCSDIGKWSEGPPPHVDRFFPEQGPSCNTPPAWLLP